VMVAALYIDARGPYPGIGVDCWSWEATRQAWLSDRDARSYAGPWPVVAHPPCGPWGRLRHLSKGAGRDCGPRAVEQVRTFGGVLEHPEGSKLWEACGLPRPGEERDAHGGYTVEVAQVDWGHVARKRTWLYLVGVPRWALVTPPPREPSHWVSGFRTSKGRNPAHYKQNGSAVPPGVKVCSAEQRRRSPIAFACYLVFLARCAGREKLLAAYREKRRSDGLNGRDWNAVGHWDAERIVRLLEGEPPMRGDTGEARP
jgi:hypothetical protein